MKMFTVTLMARVETNNDFQVSSALRLADTLITDMPWRSNSAGSLRVIAAVKCEPAEPDNRI